MPADMKSGASDPRSSGERDKALNLVLGQIERNFGKGSIMRLGDASRMRVETISTGALTLDLALGGGYPKGRVVEIYGPESSGKTTLTLHAMPSIGTNFCARCIPALQHLARSCVERTADDDELFNQAFTFLHTRFDQRCDTRGW